MIARMHVGTSLMILSIVLIGLTGCIPPSTQASEPPTPTLPPGWETYSNQGQCSYAINHPSNMDGSGQGTHSWNLSVSTTEPGLIPNFIYISVIPDGFEGGPGEIYNYDPAETQTLLNMQVGESSSLRDFDPNLAPWFTFTRLPDTTLSNQTAQTYENNQPWEFPPGTKEIRYYLKANGCTYLIGGYFSTVGSGQTGAIDQELFDQIITTFRLAP